MRKMKEFKTDYEQDNDIISYQKAQKKLSALDPQVIVNNTDALFDPDNNRFKLKILGKEHFVSYPEGKVTTVEGKKIHFPLNVLILHYLTQASGRPLKGKLISYREVPEGGEVYYGAFKRAAIDPLVQNFGHKPELLLKASKHLNGKQVSIGDYSITLPFFPKIPITFVIWQGDDEFAPSGNILFDGSAISYLSVKDLAFVGNISIRKLINITENIKD
ncbi:DUF3786 domain-containing protein [Selenihalanaerobacter shriftii]|uniref:DUF3786 domain-containing protein n=1 Tax=Selenihalanaerobacter shriftii TaxID=142842 RepID=A0A1T4JMD3_9FIRM|nr:DUF3786 domain-containing protein [Selenihalanaerobacter shriftii]SJZ31308.1 protein of unknown function [Selenihalanaerobacter shriftii]